MKRLLIITVFFLFLQKNKDMRFAIVLFLFVISLSAFPNIKQDSTTNIVLNKILNLEFNSAKSIINKQKIGGNYYYNYLENYNLFIKSFISEEQLDFDNFINNSYQCLEFLDDNYLDSKYNFLIRADIKLKLAVNHLKFENYTKAFTNLYSSYLLINKNVKKYPDFEENNKIDGIFNVLLGNIPSSFNIIKSIFSLKGNIKVGIAKLSAYYNRNKNINGKDQEALYILYYSSKNTFTRDLSNVLRKQKKNYKSPLYKYTLANYLASNNKNDSAIKVLESYKINKRDYPMYIIEYQLGICKLNKLDMTSVSNFNNYIKSYKGKNYIKSAYQKLYWSSLINNKPNSQYLKSINLFGSDFTDEDKQAINFDYKNINLRLLKSRLLFDGGYYDESQTVLLENYNANYYKSINEKLEYIYRFARINHKQNNVEFAKEYYNMVIQKGENVKLYYAANSALLLGLIYETQNNYEKAKEYLDKCLVLNNYEYKNSIEFKAKSALNRISNN